MADERQRRTLDVDAPSAQCGNCRFTTSLQGQWSVVDGRLRFDANPDPLTRRGPSIDYCSECGASFDVVVVQHGDSSGTERELTPDELAAVQATAAEDQAREYAALLAAVRDDPPEPE